MLAAALLLAGCIPATGPSKEPTHAAAQEAAQGAPDVVVEEVDPAAAAPAEDDSPREPSPVPPAETPQEGVGAAGIGDDYFRLMGNGGYDVQHYALDLDISMADNRIDGTARIEAVATQDLMRFNLDFTGFTITTLQVDDQPAQYTRSGSELTIIPAEELAEGQPFTVVLGYRGVPRSSSQAGHDFTSGWHYYGEQVMVAGEPGGASTWYPVNEHPLDKATYTMTISVEAPYVVAANGLLQNMTEENGAITYEWASRDPIASYLVTLAIGDFEIETGQSQSGVPIRNYFAAGVDPTVRASFARQDEMIDYFETIFGPYPFEAYGAVVHDLDLGFALETQTLSTFGSSFVDEYVVVHELAHSWFGNSVSLSDWRDIWLNEGFATYAGALWTEHVGGPRAFEEELGFYYRMVASSATDFDFPIGDPGPDNMFSRAVYFRGALTLHALRLRLGDEAFFTFLRAYADRFRYGSTSTPELIALAEEISGEELDDLFNAWLYQVPLPDIPEMGLYAADYTTSSGGR
ncbi:MAG: M1 family metallopeptidase [Anaerolineae bacterium]